MLDFFRKYQRFFFLIVTGVIIISFSFFGTYNTIPESNYHEQTVFKAVDGSEISRLELEQMTRFLETDAEDKLLWGGQWGPNFLNDGVLTEDFLKTGLGKELALAEKGALAEELQSHLDREKRYQPYAHPQAKFVSAEAAWSYVAPGLKNSYDALRRSADPTHPNAIDARIQLYLAQKKLPAPALQQLLLYQQKQFAWLQPDPALEHTDLSLFGYHSTADWFGPRWVRLMAAFVINSAKIAEQQGYKVTKAEALADLQKNAELSFKQNINSPYLGVANNDEYFKEQLNKLGIDQARAVALWQQVLLFRRLFHDAGNTALVDPYTFQKINAFAGETASGDLYRLPAEFHFSSLNDVKKFQLYLQAISADKGLNLPTQFYSVEEVQKAHPELVQKRYLLDIASVDKDTLQAKVPLKEMWKWEGDHWDQLKSQFPELSDKNASSREERLAVLDALDPKTRNKLDLFARKQIVDAHPEWLKAALDEATARRTPVALTYKGGTTPFVGLTDREELMSMLDKAKLNATENSLSPYTADHQHYYKITVLDRSPKAEIVTFAEAQKGGLLDSQAEGNEADAQLVSEIKAAYAQGIAPEKAPATIIDEIAASLRLFMPMKTAADALKKDPKKEKGLVRSETEGTSREKLAQREPLDAQWKLIKTSYTLSRGAAHPELEINKLFAVKPGQWSAIQTPANGDLHFFLVKQKGAPAESTELTQEVNQARQLLADEAERSLMMHLLKTMQAKKALSFEEQTRPEQSGEE